MNTTQVAWLVSVCSALTGLLTFVCTKGVDAYLRIREDRRKEKQDKIEADRKEQHHQEDRVETKQEEQISDLKEQIKGLVADLRKVQEDHIECVKSQAALEGQNKVLIEKVAEQRKDIDSLREWRHEVANALHTEALKKMVAVATPPSAKLDPEATP